MASKSPTALAGKKNETSKIGRIRVAEKVVAGLTPGHSGWILAFVLVTAVVVSLVEITSYFEFVARSEGLVRFFTELETNRAEENRRNQETIAQLASIMARVSEERHEMRAEITDNLATIMMQATQTNRTTPAN